MSTEFTDQYGERWRGGQPSMLQIEFHQIRKGKTALTKAGRSLFLHYRNAMTILWPSHDHHRWSDLILKSHCENDITVMIGCADSGKTWSMARIALMDYWIYPDKTLSLVSTTEGRGSELRVWGTIKDLFNEAIRAGHDVAGHPIDYLKTITTDEIDEEGELARSLRRGLIVVPCKTGGIASGLGAYVGIKAPRLRHYGDEVQFMNENFLHAYANWFGKSDFKGMMAGNFMETDDPLGIASEPVDGWDSWQDSGTTQEWFSRFYDAHVIALDGRNSPNLDFPDEEAHYSYLLRQKKLDVIRRTKGTDSWEWWSQCVGKPAKGMDVWRVISKDFCERNKAFEDAVWDGEPTKLYALDPAYGRGDRCVGRKVEFGKSVGGQQIILLGKDEIIPIKISTSVDAEDQIAQFVKSRMESLGIPPQNCFYDSFGRGTLGYSFSKVFKEKNPVPIDSGSQPTKRPVRFDLFVTEKNGNKRLKTCDEHYTKFISEMWFSVREAIDSQQLRGLDIPSCREGLARKFTKNRNAKIEIEPKDDMKKRLGYSPDLFDNIAIGLEGARRLGFQIKSFGAEKKKAQGNDWLSKQAKEYDDAIKSRQLQEV